MPSGPGAEAGDYLLREFLISSPVRGGAKGSLDWRPLGGRGSSGGKNRSRRGLF